MEEDFSSLFEDEQKKAYDSIIRIRSDMIKNLNLDLSNWDVSNVRTMRRMFAGVNFDNIMSNFNAQGNTKHNGILGISNWTMLYKVRDLSSMYEDAIGFIPEIFFPRELRIKQGAEKDETYFTINMKNTFKWTKFKRLRNLDESATSSELHMNLHIEKRQDTKVALVWQNLFQNADLLNADLKFNVSLHAVTETHLSDDKDSRITIKSSLLDPDYPAVLPDKSFGIYLRGMFSSAKNINRVENLSYLSPHAITMQSMFMNASFNETSDNSFLDEINKFKFSEEKLSSSSESSYFFFEMFSDLKWPSNSVFHQDSTNQDHREFLDLSKWKNIKHVKIKNYNFFSIRNMLAFDSSTLSPNLKKHLKNMYWKMNNASTSEWTEVQNPDVVSVSKPDDTVDITKFILDDPASMKTKIQENDDKFKTKVYEYIISGPLANNNLPKTKDNFDFSNIENLIPVPDYNKSWSDIIISRKIIDFKILGAPVISDISRENFKLYWKKSDTFEKDSSVYPILLLEEVDEYGIGLTPQNYADLQKSCFSSQSSVVLHSLDLHSVFQGLLSVYNRVAKHAEVQYGNVGLYSFGGILDPARLLPNFDRAKSSESKSVSIPESDSKSASNINRDVKGVYLQNPQGIIGFFKKTKGLKLGSGLKIDTSTVNIDNIDFRDRFFPKAFLKKHNIKIDTSNWKFQYLGEKKSLKELADYLKMHPVEELRPDNIAKLEEVKCNKKSDYHLSEQSGLSDSESDSEANFAITIPIKPETILDHPEIYVNTKRLGVTVAKDYSNLNPELFKIKIGPMANSKTVTGYIKAVATKSDESCAIGRFAKNLIEHEIKALVNLKTGDSDEIKNHTMSTVSDSDSLDMIGELNRLQQVIRNNIEEDNLSDSGSIIPGTVLIYYKDDSNNYDRAVILTPKDYTRTDNNYRLLRFINDPVSLVYDFVEKFVENFGYHPLTNFNLQPIRFCGKKQSLLTKAPDSSDANYLRNANCMTWAAEFPRIVTKNKDIETSYPKLENNTWKAVGVVPKN